MNQPSRRLYIVSGIPADDSGTGRLIGYLESALQRTTRDVVFLYGPANFNELKYSRTLEKKQKFQLVKRILSRSSNLIRHLPDILWGDSDLLLFHPQNLGFKLSLFLLKNKSSGKRKLYLLDSSYFCIRSYNHLQGENAPCLRCLGGNFEHNLKCTPFPQPLRSARAFVRDLFKLVRSGHVEIITQSETQARVAQEHFQACPPPTVAGLWTRDFEALNIESPHQVAPNRKRPRVVFHGFPLEAKGFQWTLQLAAHCPEIDFLFPFAYRPHWPAKDNFIYKSMSWETGLSEEVRAADLTIVPSLWSAPIEGAIVKSLILSKHTAVVDNSSAYCSELPTELVLRLPVDPLAASQALKIFFDRDPIVHQDALKQKWLQTFGLNREKLLKTLEI